MYKIIDILNPQQIAQIKDIAGRAKFVDGRITNPHNTAKKNEQLHDPTAYQQSAQILHNALSAMDAHPKTKSGRGVDSLRVPA